MDSTIHYRLLWRSLPTDSSDIIQLLCQWRHRILGFGLDEVGELMVRVGAGADYRCFFGNDAVERWVLAQASQLVEHGDLVCDVTPRELHAFVMAPGAGCEPFVAGLCRYPQTLTIDGIEVKTQLAGWCWQGFWSARYASDYGGAEHLARCRRRVLDVLAQAVRLGLQVDVKGADP